MNKSIATPLYTRQENITAQEAKQLLRDGNKRYIHNEMLPHDTSDDLRKKLSSTGQKPFAVILSCSDSRVIPELIFDQGLGDLFIIRAAGNIVDSVVLGSIEYGVSNLNSPLVVVLGHDECGAVKAAMDGVTTPKNVEYIVNKIKPSCEKAKIACQNHKELYHKSIIENIKNSLKLINESALIQHLSHEKTLEVIGAHYNMTTGEVSFL